ncbi:hypothetical protein D9O29_05520 [Pantoea vagans]|uniref:Uncharacterized protein n=1 Tax=Pantoea vagans TaxID=470934 RepID=A0ABY3LIA4_9GAMM|nr:hypothetical protein D9O29_05520 [Pantoea vagans]
MSNKTSPPLLTRKEMQSLALIHIQSYLNACHCRSRSDVLQALDSWKSTGDELTEFIRNTRIVIISESGTKDL